MKCFTCAPSFRYVGSRRFRTTSAPSPAAGVVEGSGRAWYTSAIPPTASRPTISYPPSSRSSGTSTVYRDRPGTRRILWKSVAVRRIVRASRGRPMTFTPHLFSSVAALLYSAIGCIIGGLGPELLYPVWRVFGARSVPLSRFASTGLGLFGGFVAGLMTPYFAPAAQMFYP